MNNQIIKDLLSKNNSEISLRNFALKLYSENRSKKEIYEVFFKYYETILENEKEQSNVDLLGDVMDMITGYFSGGNIDFENEFYDPNMEETKYVAATNRVLVDIDNDRRFDCDIVGLSKTDEILDFEGNSILLKEGQYIHTYTDNIENGVPSYIFAEGYVIRSPYKDVACKWWCKIQGEIEYSEDYNRRFNVNE